MKIEENLTPIVEGSLVVGEEGGDARVIRKVVDPYSGMAVGGATSGRNGWRRCCCGRQWWWQRGSCLCLLGGELDDAGGGKVTYIGGWTECIVLKEDMGLEKLRRKVSEITCNDLTVRKLWYSLKYDRGMVMELEGDGDGNDEHGYLYVDESDGLKRHTQKAMRTCDDGVIRGAAVSESGGCIDDHPQTRLRVSGEIIEMFNDDEILIVLEDVGEDMAAAEGGEESSKAVECYSSMSGEYIVELTNSHNWDNKLTRAGSGKREAKLWVYDYVHPIYKTTTQQIIYNQLVHPMETHDMGIVDVKTGRVVSRDELDDDYDRCILPLTNGRQPGRPPSKDREGQGLGGAPNVVKLDTRGTLVAILVPTLMLTMKAMLWRLKIYWMAHTFQIVLHCANIGLSAMSTPPPLFVIKYIVACSPVSGNLKFLPGRRQMFTMVNHILQPVNPWVTIILQSCHFDVLIILDSELSPHPHLCSDFNVTCFVSPAKGRC
ncbi:hypothetical protein Cgig2_007815 [Carnegiea gigantea]|uniref:Uncharacterized protein n=1 Tax=Carnegiea gigantea TaxID=171969 RepID=A0A9Q1GV12_9CARY|nr:hypothetical protein Cgig2_007815 [Carnegiea gigantea]